MLFHISRHCSCHLHLSVLLLPLRNVQHERMVL